jgi:class 3 adenylate cyclase
VQPKTRYARSGDLSIAYQVFGSGPRDLVLVPGFVSHIELLWERPAVARVLRRLASFSRLILFDKREQGLSDRVGRPPALEESMEDVIAVLDAADSESATLFGISEGGPMTILAAATYADRVRSLALYGTYAKMTRAPDYPEGVPEDVLAEFGETAIAEWGGPVTIDLWAPSLAGDAGFAEWWGRVLRQGASPGGAVDLLNLYQEIDVRPILGAVGCPTLVMHRSGDRLVRPAMGRHLAENIPGSRYVELEGPDHLIFAGDTERLVDELEELVAGSRGAHEPDRVLATVLFTDIVDSTSTASRLGDAAWRGLLERHDEIVRRQIELYGGREIKTLGDGFLATFEGPARALRCADAIRDRLAAEGIEVRAGVHTGEVELIGGDIGGMAVNIGARVADAAGAGEVLATSTVKDLVVGSGIQFDDRGVHELKGVPGEWHLLCLET